MLTVWNCHRNRSSRLWERKALQLNHSTDMMFADLVKHRADKLPVPPYQFVAILVLEADNCDKNVM